MAPIKGNGKRNFLAACLDCFPQHPPPAPSSPPYRSTRYNAQIRENLNLPQYPLKLPTRVENQGGVITAQPQRTPRPSMEPSEHRKSSNHPRLPLAVNVAGGGDPRPNWSSSVLRTSQLVQLFETVAGTLEHVPYAICGLGALVDHGFSDLRVTRVSVLCPAYAKDNVRGWLASRGYETYADSVGIPIANGNMTVRVRIKYLEQGFENLERVKSSMSNAWVLSLTSQLDHAAAGYVDSYRHFQRLEEEKGNGKGAATKASQDADERVETALKTISRDIFWCLEKAAKTRHHLDPKFLPTLLGEEFWAAFTQRHDNARTEFARAGIDVAAVLAKQKDVAFMREHRALLKEYNVEARGSAAVDDADENRSAFEGMRTLTRNKSNSKSVYTHRDPLDSPRAPDTPSWPLTRRQEQPAEEKRKSGGKGKGKLDGFVAGLLKMPNSEREGRPTTTGADGYNYGVTRSNSVKALYRNRLRSPPPRFSEDVERVPMKWV
ncbi:hypothetical protein GGS26DRAFT_191853 [Hypomontagnella submonticulosa]|nr:hypothetical protein GGS26DRAFT_191853 [Hypomontagnella submonticulosa]